KDIEILHQRHPFSHSSTTILTSQLDIATIDCEGFYTTQGMSVARVSVCDGDGKVVFDELVRPDEGVSIMAQEFLGRSIQTGGEIAGHSSAEDALATLDLVKYYVQNRKGKEQQKLK
ncbi:2548_t:CDS:2, partial [Acaulospora colombiana]